MKSVKEFSKYTWLRFVASRNDPRAFLKCSRWGIIQTELLNADFNDANTRIEFRIRIRPHGPISYVVKIMLIGKAITSSYSYKELYNTLFSWDKTETMIVNYK